MLRRWTGGKSSSLGETLNEQGELMCDYSLMSLRNRLANDGEELITYRFPTGTIGLASPSDIDAELELHPHRGGFWSLLKDIFSVETSSVPAVCIPPGTSLLLADIPAHLQRELDICVAEPVIFTQISVVPSCHRDAVRFRNGREIVLQRLGEGLHALVISTGVRTDAQSGTTGERTPGVRGMADTAVK